MKLAIGAVYSVFSRNGCVVSFSDGTECLSVPAEEVRLLLAQEEEMQVSDPAAIVSIVPNGAEVLHGVMMSGYSSDKLPAGYTRVDFLESTGIQAIVLPVNKNNPKSLFMSTEVQFTALPAQGTGAQEGCNPQYQWGLWGSASGGTSVFMAAYNTSGNLSLGKVGESWNSWTTCTIGYDAPHHRWGKWGSFSAEDEGSYAPPNVTEFVLFCVKSLGSFAYTQKAKKRWLILKADGVTLYSLIPALTPTGEPCMYDRVSRKPFRNAGTGSFIAGVGSVAQLTGLLRNLPATGGELTLSLPAEANTPEFAEMLRACHDTKGWTITVHEYRPAAAATYSLRRVREVVWCRRELSDLGSYVDPHGYRWQIDRCVAIFGRLGNDPTAYGYTPFDSVEQAVEFWEMVPYVDPNAEELSNVE